MDSTRLHACVALAAMVLFSAGAVLAQDDSPEATAKSEMDKAMRMMEAFVKASVEFSKDIKLTEDDLKKWIEIAPSFNEIGKDDAEEEDVFDKGYKDGKFSFDVILKDDEYRKWVGARGLDATQWLKRHIRINMFLMREQGLKHVAMAEKQLPEQRKQIEAMKGQLDEKTYAQLKSTLDTSAAMLKTTKKLYNSIPEPTEAEAKLLKKYERKLLEIMESDDEEEEFGPEDMEEEDEEEIEDEDEM